MHNKVADFEQWLISILFSLATPVAISSNCRCVFGSHFPEIQTASPVRWQLGWFTGSTSRDQKNNLTVMTYYFKD